MSAARGSLKDRVLAASSGFYEGQRYFTGSIQIASTVTLGFSQWYWGIQKSTVNSLGGLMNVSISNEDRQSGIGYSVEYTSFSCGGNICEQSTSKTVP